MLLEFPPGRSVLPHSPTNSVSPVNNLLPTNRHMLSGVCPGVCITFIGDGAYVYNVAIFDHDVSVDS